MKHLSVERYARQLAEREGLPIEALRELPWAQEKIKQYAEYTLGMRRKAKEAAQNGRQGKPSADCPGCRINTSKAKFDH